MFIDHPLPIWLPPKPAIIRPYEDLPPAESVLFFAPPPFYVKKPSRTFLQVTQSTANGATQTFAGINLGAPAADRYILIAFSGIGTSNRTVTGVTCDGVALSAVVSRSNGNTGFEMWGGIVGTANSSGSVVVSLNGGVNGAIIAAERLTGLNSTTPVATSSGLANGTAITAAASTGGIVIAAATSNANTSCTWAGDVTADGAGVATFNLNITLSIASKQGTTTTPATATGTLASTSQQAFLIATFR